jgi:class 3 adenylate cyclase
LSVTIVCADMAGYSRLIELDEEGTIARLKAYRRALIDPAVARHGGRIVKTMGDGLLLEFALLGQPEKTKGYVRQGIRLSPRDPFLVYWWLYIGVAQLHQGQDEAALDTFRKAIEADPSFPSS